ncbi:MAG TPA: AI-2E family transporter [Vicinamibacterales bacterium]|nr:AI-2E family transporter [Vicinamibacterales bacterium]
MTDSGKRRVAVEVPWRTLLKIIAAVALVWLCMQLIQTVLVLIVAVLLAVTLGPVVAWFERRGLPRWGATAVVTVVLLALIGGFVWLTWASLSDQLQYVSTHANSITHQLQEALPPFARNAIGDQHDIQSRVAPYAVRFLQSAMAALVVGVLGFILTMYLLLEGRQTRDWLVAFVAKDKRPKVEQTLVEGERVIFGYVAGNIATSIFATVFVLVSLSILKVPAALLLAVIAGLCDFIPVLGFILSSLPALALAFTVSGKTALIVAILYLCYHTAENYFIAPYVYGDRLKLSNVAVILAFAVGAELAGVIGALIALPLAAVYPAIERIWLRHKLGEETVREHRVIERRKAG